MGKPKFDAVDELEILHLHYHRNGVGGRPYMVARFRYTTTGYSRGGYEAEPEKGELLGIVPLGDDLSTSDILVIDPDKPNDSYRGADYFGQRLKQAVDEAYEKNPDAAHHS